MMDDSKPPRQLAVQLQDHQKQGLLWMRVHEDLTGGGVLADDQGLGKTITMLATMLANAPAEYAKRYRGRKGTRMFREDCVSGMSGDSPSISSNPVPAAHNPLAYVRNIAMRTFCHAKQLSRSSASSSSEQIHSIDKNGGEDDSEDPGWGESAFAESDLPNLHKYFQFTSAEHQVMPEQMRFRAQGESQKTLVVVPPVQNSGRHVG